MALAPQKELLQYEKIFNTNTEFFSSCNPDLIEDQSLVNLKEHGVQPKISDSKYKLKFDIFSKDNSGNNQEVKMTIRILRVDEQKYCVEFTKLAGDQIRFTEHFNQFRTKVLSSLNDSTFD